MIGLALDKDFDTRDAGNRGHQADINSFLFEHRPLLDMQFEKGADVRSLLACQPRRVTAHLDNPLAQGEIPLRPAQPAIRQDADHAAAADAGDAEDRDFLGQKIDDFQIVIQPDIRVI